MTPRGFSWLRKAGIKVGMIGGVLFWAAAPAMAGGGAELTDKWLGVPRWILLTINLFIFFGGLGYVLGPLLKKYLGDKQEAIRSALADAERQQREARDMAATLAAQIAELQAEVEELRARAEREGERERAEILAEAERERQRFEAQAEEEVRRRLQQAREELTRHAVALASRLAEERVVAKLTAADQSRLFGANLTRLEKRLQNEQGTNPGDPS